MTKPREPLTFVGRADDVRVIEISTGAVWRWVNNQWIRVGRYHETELDLGDDVVQLRTKGRDADDHREPKRPPRADPQKPG